MNHTHDPFFREVNDSRYYRHNGAFYESYFLRANHPSAPQAFWLRYTLLHPKTKHATPVGELWGFFFDGLDKKIWAAKQSVAMTDCFFSHDQLAVCLGKSTLRSHAAHGSIDSGGTTMAWDLLYSARHTQPVPLLPRARYGGNFPAAKSIASVPIANFSGTLTIDGRCHTITDWRGSQNHNWGTRHTDRYAWCQVSGFDNAPASYFEAATAQLKIGPCWTPTFTPCVLIHDHQSYALNGVWRSLHNAVLQQHDCLWEFTARTSAISLRARISGDPALFANVRYQNTNGATKLCRHNALAGCEVWLQGMANPTAEPVHLMSAQGASFETLDDRSLDDTILLLA